MVRLSKKLFSTIRRIQITTTHIVDDVLAGAYHSAFKGRGIEFEDVREYLPGDDIRSIDWNVTARYNAPFVKRYREERELTVMLVIDISGSARYGSGDHLKSEVIAEIGAVLAFSAIKNNDRVGLLLFSDQVEHYLPPQKGVRHVLRVIRDLLAFQPKGTGTNINCALEFFGRIHKKKGICFLISDFLAAGYETELTVTSKRHDLISIAVSDQYEKKFPSMGLLTLRDLETGEIKIVDTSRIDVRSSLTQATENRLNTHKVLMKRIGAGHIDISDSRDYATPISKFFKKRERKR